MYKELIISIIIVIGIYFFNNITQKYTNETVDTIKQDLSEVRYEINQDEINQNIVDEKLQKTEANWEGRKEILAYYIEHDELEKVETHLTMLKSNIEMNELAQAVEEIDTCSFILEHIQDKESFKLKNIF